MLTKVSKPNHLASSNIIKFFSLYDKNSDTIDKIQDNMEGYLIILYKNSHVRLYNYNLKRFYSHNKIQICFNGYRIIKQIDSFDQNNWIMGNYLRKFVLNRINQIDRFEFNINKILGIGGEYYLYWIGLSWVNNLVGISNHISIIDDANTNIKWSSNYLVDYNNFESYPKITQTDLVLINLFKINFNIITYLNMIEFKKIILITCNLHDKKLKLLTKYFKFIKIKYFQNFENLLRVIELVKK
jgi:hypothetical protein